MDFSNKKILFCHLHNIDQVGVGIKNKIYAQLQGFKDLGFDVSFLTGINKGIQFNGDKEYVSFLSEVFLRIKRPIIALKKLKGIHFDFIYVRGFGIDPALLWFLRSVKKENTKIIFEFPTFPYDDELRGQGLIKTTYWVIDKISRNYLKRYVDLSTNFNNLDKIYGIKSIPISNCIDVSKIDFTGFEKKENELNLIGVAGLTTYHGFDRVIQGIANYNKGNPNYKVYFHIVGKGEPELAKLKKMVLELNVAESVIFYGELFGRELTEVFREKQIGVGALGMHRKGLVTGSVLKVREYFARGIPVLLSYDDYGLRLSDRFYFLEEGADIPINLINLIIWFEKINFNSKTIRQIAEKSLSWKEELRLVFLSCTNSLKGNSF